MMRHLPGFSVRGLFLGLLGLTWGAGALDAQCNPCHTCPWDPDRRIVLASGVSTINVFHPEMLECGSPEEWCEDLGALCGGGEFTAEIEAEHLVNQMKMGASVDLQGFIDRFPDTVRVNPERRVVLVTSDCTGEIVAVLPLMPH
jgi:hypothetical protein